MRKVFLLLFFALNLLAALIANRPKWFETPSYTVNQVLWQLRRYAHWTGTDARWEMFSYMYRDDWKLVFKARSRGAEDEMVLPLALQSPRSFLEDWLFDFKEAKIRLNIYSDKNHRERYQRFLCRNWNNSNTDQLAYVACDLESQPLLPRSLARAMNQHRVGHIKITRFDETPCESLTP